MRQKVVPIIIAVALIIIIGGAAVGVQLWDKYFSYSKERVDLDEYLKVTASDDVAIILQNQRIDTKARLIDGRVYMDLPSVQEIFNYRFYQDEHENLLIYATANDLYINGIETSQVDKSGSVEDLGYIPAVYKDDTLYISLDYVQKFTNLTYTFCTEPNRVVVRNDWGAAKVARVKKDSAIRLRGGVKSELIREVAVDENLIILEELEDWVKAITDDGLSGYIERKHITEIEDITESVPLVYEEEEYTTVHKDMRINMSWHPIYGVGGNDTFDTYVDGTGTMSFICPTWFQLKDNEGNYDNFASKTYVDKAHSRNMEVWAVLDNVNHPAVETYEIMSYTSKRQRLISSLMQQVESLNLDGINLDFEQVPEKAIAHYVEFIRELSIECRKRQIVLSVDNYSPEGGSYYGLGEQGKVVDYVVLMGYDEHWGGGGVAGSVASKGFLERGIQMILDAGVPEDKLVCGVPFYTRLWKSRGATVESVAMTMDDAEAFVSNNGMSKEWNEETCQNYAEKEAGGTLYQIWLEDAESIDTKLHVMDYYNVAGVASWALGQENKSIWSTIDKYVLGMY